ncbi:TonB-dependent receptor domain-containing protein [Azovibrio restrictus]|uniref:TonB-dependent receptor domain-containing protein n=1 Tax=Azovibrio restrictus TaxID=146938 RepID=UPI0026F124D8|nr:TonB-dependent receptor [Azovibrio restrictus]
MSFKQKPLAAALCLLALPISPTLAQNAEEQIVVTATRQPQRANELLSDVTVIERQEIEAAGPSASITDLLARQPGIEIKTDGAPGSVANIYLRGSNPGHTLLLVDGMRSGSATMGGANWSYLPLEQVERIEILRGAASSLYGSDAIGGVIQIFTRKGSGPLRVNAAAGLGSHRSSAVSAGLSGSQQGLSYALQAASHRTRGFNSIDNPANSSYNPDRDGHRNSSMSGSLSYAFAPDQEIGVNFLASDGWNDYDAGGPWSTPATAAYRQEQKNSVYSIYSRNRLGSLWTSTLRLGRSSDDSRQFEDDRETGRIRTRQTQYQWQNDIRLPLGTALLALERLEERVSSDQAYDLDRRSINSILAGWNGSLGNHRLQFNLRRDDNSQFGDKNTGFVAYGYQINDKLRAHASYGTAFKAPTFNDLYWPGAGNPNLKPETAKNREIALHYDSGTQQISATIYRNDVDNLIAWAPIAPGSWTWLPANVNQARLEGFTLAYTGNLQGFNVKASADFQDPRDTLLDKVLRYRSRQHGSLAVGRSHGNFDWNLEWQAHGKRYQDVNNTQKLGGYALVNLQAGYRLDKDWSLFARVNNLFDREYVLNQDYATDGANFFLGVRYAPK